MSTTKYEEGDKSDNAVKSADEQLNLTNGEPAPKDSDYDEDDEAMIRSRLEALGYL